VTDKFKDKSEARLSFFIFIGVFVFTFVLAIAVWGYFYPDFFRDNGEWGDFFGGMLNPVLSTATFLGVLLTIRIQMEELKDSRVELRRSADALESQITNLEVQRFEQMFHNLLSMQEQIVNSIDILNASNGTTITGRDCFSLFYKRLDKTYRKKRTSQGNQSLNDEILQDAYDEFWKFHKPELSHYFRFTYNFLRVVEESNHSKPHHKKILRSIFSDQELLVTFYNCISKDGQNYKIYAESFQLFDNLPIEQLLEPEHKSKISSLAFGENKL
jgi:hypothetical protein